ISLASWPIETATHVQPTSASTTESGSAGPANWIEIRIEKAIAAPGAMCVIDWKRTCGSPIDSSRRWSKERLSARAAISPPCDDACGGDAFRSIAARATGRESIPGRWVVDPAAAEHGGDDAHLGELVGGNRERVAVEHDQVGEVAGGELAAAALVAGEPRGREDRRRERLLDGDALLRVPGRPVVERPADAGADP